jgi:hypothetical protein
MAIIKPYPTRLDCVTTAQEPMMSIFRSDRIYRLTKQNIDASIIPPYHSFSKSPSIATYVGLDSRKCQFNRVVVWGIGWEKLVFHATKIGL